jgi:hypothetical protein
VKQKDMAKARTYLAEDFKASTNEQALSDFLARSAIINFRESSWSNRQINNGRGDLEGEITTDSGGVVPIKLSFVKENKAWKIYAIQKPTAGIQSGDNNPPSTPPDKTQQIALVKQSIHDFVLSVGKKDMSHFRSTVSVLWQQQSTDDSLNQSFNSIIATGSDWSVLNSVEPELSEAKIDENGVLHLSGRYPTKPSQVTFQQSYIYEGSAWKLMGFSIEAI